MFKRNDPTTTALQWVMANVVKYQHVQEKLFNEIKGVVAEGDADVKEDDLQKMPYLKAVVLETLRRHPPVYLAATPHMATEDTELDGYFVPKNTAVNFLITEIGWDPNMWENPMEFKRERFLFCGEEVDITGSKEIKMMPFGAGRRICPALGFVVSHLQYFVANLVWHFRWTPTNGEDVDLSEKLRFTSGMKNPLRADISLRIK